MNKNFSSKNQELVDSFFVDIDGFEGPLHLLLELSKKHKIDLKKIAIFELAEQYLNYINQEKKLEIEIAADYLLMASWLVFLKSKLFLPIESIEEEKIDELTELLAQKLKNLEKIRNFSGKINKLEYLGKDFFSRGEPEIFSKSVKVKYSSNLLDLISAYYKISQEETKKPLKIFFERFFTVEDALKRIKKLIKNKRNWTNFDNFLPEFTDNNEDNYKSAVTSSFVASLELAKSGKIDINQDKNFSNIYLKGKIHE